MKKIIYIYLILISALMFAACSSEDTPGDEDWSDDVIAISYSQKKFDLHLVNATRSVATRATDDGTADEQQINEIIVLLFDNSGQNPIKYTVNGASFTGGTWDSSGELIKLSLTQAEAGTRQVYLVANPSAALKTYINNSVGSVSDLMAALETIANPWSSNLTTPILMSGSVTHNFVANKTLTVVQLERTLAKVTMDITLKEEFQSAVTSSGGKTPEYKYRFVNFDKETYVLNPGTKDETDLVTSPWTDWTTAEVTTDSDGIAIGLELATYLNERFTKGAKIEIQMFYNDGGMLPPPEFGAETYILPLPDNIKRNHWYKYNVEL